VKNGAVGCFPVAGEEENEYFFRQADSGRLREDGLPVVLPGLGKVFGTHKYISRQVMYF
jgi:hypothetical protein